MLKALMAIGLSMAFSTVVATETPPATPTHQDSATTTETRQQPKKLEANQPSTENKSSAKQPSNTEKKPSMADYCRKHPC